MFTRLEDDDWPTFWTTNVSIGDFNCFHLCDLFDRTLFYMFRFQIFTIRFFLSCTRSKNEHSLMKRTRQTHMRSNEYQTKSNFSILLEYTQIILKKNLSRAKQRILEVHLPLNRPDLKKHFFWIIYFDKYIYFIYFENREHRKQFAELANFLFKKELVQFFESC